MKRAGSVFAVLFAPTGVLIVLFLVPMAILLWMSVLANPPGTMGGLTLSHYKDVFTDHLNLKTTVTTFWMVTVAMIAMLVVAVPLAYFMVFRSGKWEMFLLLALVIADELAPVVKVYAWQVVLGHKGLINQILPGPPIDWLLFSPFAVVLTLATSYITYTTIPIYAAMKAIDPVTLEAAHDLGAGWWVQMRRILVPLSAPGMFVAVILVYIPMFTDFVDSDIVGGPSSYMLGQRVRDVILSDGDWGSGSALSFLLLVGSVLVSIVAYRLARLNRLETAP